MCRVNVDKMELDYEPNIYLFIYNCLISRGGQLCRVSIVFHRLLSRGENHSISFNASY